MGTFADVDLAGDVSRDALIALSHAVYAELQRLDAKYSFHRPDSVLSMINRSAARGEGVDLDPESAELFAMALHFSALSEGLFDICVAPHMIRAGALPGHFDIPINPGRWTDLHLTKGRIELAQPTLFDLGGIAKGYAVDRALSCLPVDVEATINLGGDLRMTEWQQRSIALRGPEAITFVAPMYAPAVATSIAAPGEHLGVLIDPRCGLPAADTRSYSIYADSAIIADALTKLVMLGVAPEKLWQAGALAVIRIDSAGGIEQWLPTTSCH